MKKNRFLCAGAAIIAVFYLTACQTTQKAESTTSIATPEPGANVEMPTDKHTVKGINGWEGEIIGKPTQESKFTNLKIGMGMREVTDLIGQPTDQNAYVTGKTWIPFYYGSDRYRHELVYKGQGRLVFAGGVVGDHLSGYLISIIHNAKE